MLKKQKRILDRLEVLVTEKPLKNCFVESSSFRKILQWTDFKECNLQILEEAWCDNLFWLFLSTMEAAEKVQENPSRIIIRLSNTYPGSIAVTRLGKVENQMRQYSKYLEKDFFLLLYYLLSLIVVTLSPDGLRERVTHARFAICNSGAIILDASQKKLSWQEFINRLLNECCFCLQEINPSIGAVELPCKHRFHKFLFKKFYSYYNKYIIYLFIYFFFLTCSPKVTYGFYFSFMFCKRIGKHCACCGMLCQELQWDGGTAASESLNTNSILDLSVNSKLSAKSLEMENKDELKTEMTMNRVQTLSSRFELRGKSSCDSCSYHEDQSVTNMQWTMVANHHPSSHSPLMRPRAAGRLVHTPHVHTETVAIGYVHMSNTIRLFDASGTSIDPSDSVNPTSNKNEKGVQNVKKKSFLQRFIWDFFLFFAYPFMVGIVFSLCPFLLLKNFPPLGKIQKCMPILFSLSVTLSKDIAVNPD
ncbi:hypothetical protein RFI_24838 [Reticulomyxa filosa]|uniref:Uncharacterized protein n=1 Tax=Reticulomyxa filosa TaxID=46433 RepID=X6MFT3_RETFI|nr:hypothetical protein RFI_24838 [Reticulomyxa filosa]|eukprot:ETO12536.1 hypothetical protein RFI_24838 [Reticulomyxa filosa]